MVPFDCGSCGGIACGGRLSGTNSCGGSSLGWSSSGFVLVPLGDEFGCRGDGFVGDLDEVGDGLDVVDDAADAVLQSFVHVVVSLLDLGGGGVEGGRVGLEVVAVEGGEDFLRFFCTVAEKGAVGRVVAG